jgi:hypothetical protein
LTESVWSETLRKPRHTQLSKFKIHQQILKTFKIIYKLCIDSVYMKSYSAST